MENIITTYKTDWDETITIFEIEGQIYQRDEDGEVEAVEFDQHIEAGKVPMTRENVEEMGFEIDTYTDEISLPTDCFKWDAECMFGEEAAEKLMDFFAKELKVADDREDSYIEELKCESESMRD